MQVLGKDMIIRYLDPWAKLYACKRIFKGRLARSFALAGFSILFHARIIIHPPVPLESDCLGLAKFV